MPQKTDLKPKKQILKPPLQSLVPGSCGFLPLIAAGQLTGAQVAAPIRLQTGEADALGVVLAGRSLASANPLRKGGEARRPGGCIAFSRMAAIISMLVMDDR